MKTTIQSRVRWFFLVWFIAALFRRIGCAPPGARPIRWWTRSSLIQACMRDSSRSFSRKLRPSGTSPRNFST